MMSLISPSLLHRQRAEGGKLKRRAQNVKTSFYPDGAAWRQTADGWRFPSVGIITAAQRRSSGVMLGIELSPNSFAAGPSENETHKSSRRVWADAEWKSWIWKREALWRTFQTRQSFLWKSLDESNHHLKRIRLRSALEDFRIKYRP